MKAAAALCGAELRHVISRSDRRCLTIECCCRQRVTSCSRLPSPTADSSSQTADSCVSFVYLLHIAPPPMNNNALYPNGDCLRRRVIVHRDLRRGTLHDQF